MKKRTFGKTLVGGLLAAVGRGAFGACGGFGVDEEGRLVEDCLQDASLCEELPQADPLDELEAGGHSGGRAGGHSLL